MDKVKLEMGGPLTEEEMMKREELKKKNVERFRLARQPVKYDEDGKPVYTEKQLARRRQECERQKRRMRQIREMERKGELTPEQLEKRLQQKKLDAERAKFKRIEKQIEGFTEEEIRKHEEYNAKRKEKQRLERERIRAERGPVKRKIDRRTLAKLKAAQQEPLEIVVSLKQSYVQLKQE